MLILFPFVDDFESAFLPFVVHQLDILFHFILLIVRACSTVLMLFSGVGPSHGSWLLTVS